ncbi:YveK family protein [Bacillus sp. FJAT-29937]|uniref:YveK family protein n=1 Tax=Bacillus sp. FJAT-29937 TaxID=1720553 RepID=UPI0009E907FD|nr:Wzz/FepE/Etk N-terminal domain-containing protein [Bacillus sp. FJAT-29937]
MEERIKIHDILKIVKKRLLLIVLITSLSVIAAGIISYHYLTPIYESSTQLLINQKNIDQETGRQIDVRTNVELINTYRVIIKTPVILDKVKAEMKIDRSLKELSNQISISSEQNSQVVNITVQDKEPKMAVEIANTIANIFMNEIKVIMNVDNVTILSSANEETSIDPVKPRPMLNMLITFTASLLLSIGLIFLLEYLDDTIKSEHDIKSTLNLPVLGSIPIKSASDFQTKVEKNTEKNAKKKVRKRQEG